MSVSDDFIEGPFEVELKVSITDGERTGTVTYGMSKAETPTSTDIQNALEACARDAAKQGFRLMDRAEFLSEMVGARVVIPGPKVFPGTAKWNAIFDDNQT